MKYITQKELTQIAALVETINSALGKSEVYLCKAAISDGNGDILGYVDITDNGDYGFILDYEDGE